MSLKNIKKENYIITIGILVALLFITIMTIVAMTNNYNKLEVEYNDMATRELYERTEKQALTWLLQDKIIEGRDVKDVEIELYIAKQDIRYLVDETYMLEVLFKKLGQYSGVDGSEFEMWLYDNDYELWRWIAERRMK